MGRGLRRTSYEVNPETGLFDPEYVNIFGVPFTFLPHEEAATDRRRRRPPKTRIEPLREREAQFEISWPNVVRIDHVYAPKLTPGPVESANGSTLTPPRPQRMRSWRRSWKESRTSRS